MTIHLERKNANNTHKYPYQRLSYDITPCEDNKLSILELSKILDEFAKNSDGEFAYCITGDHIVDESGNATFGEVLFGEDFSKRNNL